jgi:threonine/homoserine/homoserine lactone efflux protein
MRAAPGSADRQRRRLALVWGVAAAVGSSTVLTASHLAYTALRVVGAAYMIWMGAGMLRDSLKRSRPLMPGGEGVRAEAG